ncbi:hypothetical protein C8J57DRAFT_1246153 [Mycena rebaudengoi]|nr:hypothetical protein C8J57DRAFT_1246153 [Mycena rebaudengoi]
MPITSRLTFCDRAADAAADPVGPNGPPVAVLAISQMLSRSGDPESGRKTCIRNNHHYYMQSSGMSKEGLEIPEAPRAQGKRKRINSRWINPSSFPTTMGKPGTEALNAPALAHLGIMAQTSDDSVACKRLLHLYTLELLDITTEDKGGPGMCKMFGDIIVDSDDEYKGQLVPAHHVVNRDNRLGCISRTRLHGKVKLIYNERGKAGQQLDAKKERKNPLSLKPLTP